MLILENGNYLVLSTDISDINNKGIVLEIDKNTGEVVKRISLKEIFSDIKYTEGLFDIGSLTYKDGELIMYLNTVDTLISINYETQKINYIYSKNISFEDSYQEYLNTGDSIVSKRLSTINNIDGNIYIFNNSFSNEELNSECEKIQIRTSSVIKYDQDFQEKHIYNLDALSIGKTDIEKISVNDIVMLSANNFTSTDNFCSSSNNLVSKIFRFKDNELIFSSSLKNSANSILSFELYKNRMNVDTSRYKIHSETDEIMEKINTNDIENYLKEIEKINLSYTIDNSYIKFNFMVSNESEIDVYFISSDAQSYKFKLKEKGKQIKGNVNIESISGIFDLYIKINDKYYQVDKNIYIK